MTSPFVVLAPLVAPVPPVPQEAPPGLPASALARVAVTTSLHLVLPTGDVLVRKVSLGDGPPFVLSQAPGPEQCGVATRREATRLALAYGAHTRVDVWIDGGHGPIRLARFRDRQQH